MNDILSLGPWPKGIVQTISAGFRPADGLDDAVNVAIDPLGAVSSARLPSTVVLNLPDVHSMWEHAGIIYGSSSGGLFTVLGNELKMHTDFDEAAVFTAIANEVVAVSRSTVGYISHKFGYSYLRRQEIEEDYDLNTVMMPGGQSAQYWNGRLVVARGSRLLFSEPFRYGTHDPLTGFIGMGNYIEWVAALPTGLFVAMDSRIVFLAGRTPAELVVKECGSSPWLGPQAFVVLDGSEFDDAVTKDAEGVVVFLTRRGFAVGMPDGAVSTPQAKNILDIGVGRCSIAYEDGFLYANLLEYQP